MAKISIPKGVVKDIIIVGVGVLVIWIGLQAAFGTPNPFYVVASGSMIPALEVHDVLIVSGHVPFADIAIGDVIVFNRPSDHNRVIVHRVASILGDDPKELRTKGDANPTSIPGTDFPITEEEYIGRVAYTLPQVGYITQLIKPPINYVIIAIVIGIMIAKQVMNRKNPKDGPDTDAEDSVRPETREELSDIDKIQRDSEYTAKSDRGEFAGSEDIAESPDIEEKTGTGESRDKPTESGDSKEKKG